MNSNSPLGPDGVPIYDLEREIKRKKLEKQLIITLGMMLVDIHKELCSDSKARDLGLKVLDEIFETLD
jgi:hypothetical protein